MESARSPGHELTAPFGNEFTGQDRGGSFGPGEWSNSDESPCLNYVRGCPFKDSRSGLRVFDSACHFHFPFCLRNHTTCNPYPHPPRPMRRRPIRLGPCSSASTGPTRPMPFVSSIPSVPRPSTAPSTRSPRPSRPGPKPCNRSMPGENCASSSRPRKARSSALRSRSLPIRS